MSIINYTADKKGNLSLDHISLVGKSWSSDYQNANPFPHIVFDNFLPEKVIKDIILKFPTENIQDNFNDKKQNKKRTFNPNDLESNYLKSIFHYFNSKRFLAFLEELTGIKGLIPDPDFLGGGFHETLRGGHLGIHADFNIHKRLILHRKINVLIYLNDNWKESYGGNLELWDKKMNGKVVSVSPTINKCVIFNTEIDSFHGHPDPLKVPNKITRKSIALYYYTSSEALYDLLPQRSTVFKKRKGSSDPNNISQSFKNFLKDFLPPIITRNFINKRIG